MWNVLTRRIRRTSRVCGLNRSDAITMPSRHRGLPRARITLLGASMMASLAACGSDTVEPVYPDTETLFWRLEVDRPAIVMSTQAPYNTVQITATAVNVHGDPIPITEPVIFTKHDPRNATFDVTADGLVTAKSTTSKQRIRATLTMNGITQSTEAWVMIRNDAVVRRILGISIQPVLPDSGVYWSIGQIGSVSPRAFYSDSTEVSNSLWLRTCSSSNTAILEFSQVMDCDGSPGTRGIVGETWIKLRLFAYGDDFVDSMLFRRIEPPVKLVQVTRVRPIDRPRTIAFQPAELTIQRGGTVVFANPPWPDDTYRPVVPEVIAPDFFGVLRTFNLGLLGDSVDVVFDDPTNILPGDAWAEFQPKAWGAIGWNTILGTIQAGVSDPSGLGGNIPAWTFAHWKSDDPTRTLFSSQSRAGDHFRTRKFTVPGTYHYHSPRFPGATGTIIVR